MCHEMGVYVVAEMIENGDQESLLRGIGIDKGQGWLYGRPSADVIIEEEQKANAK